MENLRTASLCFRLSAMVCAAWLPGSMPSGRAQTQDPDPSRAVIRRMTQMNEARRRALVAYHAERRYVAENGHFALRAEVAVNEAYSAGEKEFQIVSETGSPFIRRKVIDKLIDAEVDAGTKENHDQSQIAPENYVFRQTGTDVISGRTSYVFEVIPKAAKKYLMRGRVWIDAEDFAIVRMEGSPAKNPSFWTRKTHFVRTYEKHGVFWLPASVESDSDILIAGKSTLKINYSGYKIDSAADAALLVETAAKQGGF
ncbi:MAG TPA: hypothetical protein VEV85_23685 [Bryobacteraceae bacterium]|nr:hypothetical protein [Bryobacteraceae bacterium]